MLSRSHHGRTAATLLRPQLTLTLALAVLLCPLGRVLGQTHSPSQVLQDLLTRYGDNATISVPQLRRLLARLSQGQGVGSGNRTATTETPPATLPKANASKCLSADTLAGHSISEHSWLDGRGLKELCPTMLQQLDTGACGAEKRVESLSDSSPKPSDAEVWGFSFVSVTVIIAFSLTGVFLVPLMTSRHMNHALTYFIALLHRYPPAAA